MSLVCYLAHQTQGRTRLRALELPADPGQLARAAQSIAALPGIERAEPRPATGSLVILHPQLPGPVLLERLTAGGVAVGDVPQRPARSALAPLRAGFTRADGLLREASGGSADLHTLGYLAVGGLALLQVLRGQGLGDGSSLLWYAYNLASRAK